MRARRSAIQREGGGASKGVGDDVAAGGLWRGVEREKGRRRGVLECRRHALSARRMPVPMAGRAAGGRREGIVGGGGGGDWTGRERVN